MVSYPSLAAWPPLQELRAPGGWGALRGRGSSRGCTPGLHPAGFLPILGPRPPHGMFRGARGVTLLPWDSPGGVPDSKSFLPGESENSAWLLRRTERASFYSFVRRARRPLLAQLASCASFMWRGYLFPSRCWLIISRTPVRCRVG